MLSPARKEQDKAKPNLNIWTYALLSFAAFICALILIALLLWKVELITRFGLTENIYYLILLPLGLFVAAFLFGAMRSVGRYRGKRFGGVLELSGPIVGFALVVLWGMIYVPNSQASFSLTVFLQDETDSSNQIHSLRNQGYVLLDLGSNRRREKIGDKGEAYFPGIPANFRGQEVPIEIEADAFELASRQRRYRLNKESIYLRVRKKAGRVAGRVQDESGQPIVGASVTVADAQTTTSSSGTFAVTIPGNRMDFELTIDILAPGFSPWHETVVPNSNETVVILRRQR